MHAAIKMPDRLASYLPGKATTSQEAQASPEWPHWDGARAKEIDGLIIKGAWTQVEHPEDKLVGGTKYARSGRSARMGKYKCRLVVQGFRQIKRLYYNNTFSSNPAAASIKLVLVTA